MLHNGVDEPVLQRFLRGHIEISVSVNFNLFHWLVTKMREIKVKDTFGVQEQLGGYFHVRCLQQNKQPEKMIDYLVYYLNRDFGSRK